MGVKDTLALAKECGLTVERGTRHFKLFAPSGEFVAVVPFRNKRDKGRQQDNVRAAIRRAGRMDDGA